MEKQNVSETTVSATPKLQTTLGDLIEAILQVAEQAGKSKEECYELASVTLASVLKRAGSTKVKLH